MKISHDAKNITMTAGEVSELFTAYLNNSASMYVLPYFIAKTQDPDIREVIETSYSMSKSIIQRITEVFNAINHPLPEGFSEKDVNLNAKKLFSDRFMLIYVRYMARFGLTSYSEARACFTRADIRDLINDSILANLKLFNMADDVLLGKGIYLKEPYIPVPDRIEAVRRQSFLAGFFGDKRTLNASELNRLYLNFHRNAMGKAFLIGLSQTTKDEEIREYLLRGKKISQNHMEVVSDFLQKDDLPVPSSMDSEVTDSTDPVFSDKLVLFHVAGLSSLGLGVNGISLSRVMRRDISLAITRFISDVGLFAEDGLQMMIDRGWFERIPQAADRKELLKM